MVKQKTLTGCYSAWLASDCQTHYFATEAAARKYIIQNLLDQLAADSHGELEYDIEFHPFEDVLP